MLTIEQQVILILNGWRKEIERKDLCYHFRHLIGFKRIEMIRMRETSYLSRYFSCYLLYCFKVRRSLFLPFWPFFSVQMLSNYCPSSQGWPFTYHTRLTLPRYFITCIDTYNSHQHTDTHKHNFKLIIVNDRELSSIIHLHQVLLMV